jgi:hypothetical protein
MSNKRPLVPGFLTKLDDKLLKNHPETWTTRTHLVLWYGALFIVALAGLCFIVPDDPRTNTGIANWILLVAIVAFVAFIVWLIYLLRFNVFKRYGNTSAISRLKVFALYFVCIATIVFTTYVPPIVETTRANMAYDDEEIIKDMNAVNASVCKLEYDSLNHTWRRDTLLLVDTIPGRPAVAPSAEDDYTTTVDTVVSYPYNGKFRLIDTADFNKRVALGDSITQLRDSLYIFYECPKYTFIHTYAQPDEHTKEKLYTSEDIYRKVIKNFRPEYKMTAPAEMKALIEKYKRPYDNYTSSLYYYDQTYTVGQESYYDRVNRRYFLSNVEDSFQNIISRKYRFEDARDVAIYFRVFFYISLMLSLLVFVFRHTTVKTYFLSLLAAVLLTVLTGLFMAFSSYSATALQGWCIFYCILFFCISLTAIKSRTRTVVSGIGLNLFVLMIYFLPLLMVSYYYSQLEQARRYNPTIKINYETEMMHMQVAEIGGFILLLILIPTLIHFLYRKWFAAPEE